VWKGTSCSPSEKRCLVHLSRGGGDAVVVREFDPAAKSFVKDGFFLKEAKSDVALVDDDTVLFGTDFGPGSMTTSGYPRIVKLWKRRGITKSGPEAITMFEGQAQDVSSSAAVFNTGYGHVALIVRGVSFFEAEYYGVPVEGTSVVKLPLPLTADVKGVMHAANWKTGKPYQMLFTLREDWTPPGGAPIAKGSLVAVPIDDNGVIDLVGLAVVYAPGPRSSIEEVVTDAMRFTSRSSITSWDRCMCSVRTQTANGPTKNCRCRMAARPASFPPTITARGLFVVRKLPQADDALCRWRPRHAQRDQIAAAALRGRWSGNGAV